MTDYPKRQQGNKTHADVVVNITDNLKLYYKTKYNNGTSPNINKENLKSTVQQLTMSKEELKTVCNLLFSEDSLTVEPRPPVLMVDTSISNNINTTLNTEKS